MKENSRLNKSYIVSEWKILTLVIWNVSIIVEKGATDDGSPDILFG